jgi:hypothetical protein
MRRKYQGTREAEAFLAQLRALHRECGAPSFRKLTKISRELSRLYPDPQGAERDLPALSASAVSEILAGNRKDLPSSDWVASFVLCCQRWAIKVGSRTDDLGTRILPDWQERLRAAHAERPGRPDVSVGGGAPRDRPASECAPSAVRLPAPQHDYVAGYGVYGQRVLAGAQAGLPDAIYRVAVFLGSHPAYGEAALPLLIHAAAAGHSLALDLLEASPSRLEPLDAARHACQLADAAESEGSHAEALACYQCAAQGGLPIAAVKLAVTLLAGHGEHQAAAWLEPVAGHWDGTGAGSDLAGPRRQTEPAGPLIPQLSSRPAS